MGPGWDMHSDQATGVIVDQRLPPGLLVRGRVICHHAFGIGVRLADLDQYGHVNATQISDGIIRGPEDFPAIGAMITTVVLGYSGAWGQLRLSALAPDLRQAQTPPNRET